MQPIATGQRVFTCGHSFHAWVAPILADLAAAAGINSHRIAGVASVGGSTAGPPYLSHHWNLPDEANAVKRALRSGDVDVLTLSPIWLPDPGIDHFTALAVRHNPAARVTVQAFWLPNDEFVTTYPLPTRKPVDHNAARFPELRERHEPYFQSVDDNVRRANEAIGRRAALVVPVGQAVLALRERIIAGEAPGLIEQEDLFHDTWGHPLQPIQLLTAHCHFAVIYRRSPQGLPLPSDTAMEKVWPAKREWRNPELNALLQRLAWDAVRSHEMSGVSD